jgi:uncharacterized protein YlaI
MLTIIRIVIIIKSLTARKVFVANSKPIRMYYCQELEKVVDIDFIERDCKSYLQVPRRKTV